LSWGFDDRAGFIELRNIARLAAPDWDAYLPVLRANYPRWTFTDHPSI
jgi:hypothetical protein